LIDLFPRKILVVSNIRYSREYFCEMTAPRAAQRRAQYLAVLLLGTAIVLGCTLLQRFNQVFWQISNHQLSHVSLHQSHMTAMLALEMWDCKQC
jgi:hypothetical protein